MYDLKQDEIVSIELIGEADTVDITVADVHMFFANDIYTHNSAAKDEIIDADKIAGAYAKIMACDLVISANRTSQDKNDKTSRFHVIKNRNGPDGMTFPAIVDLENVRIDLYDPFSPEGMDITERSKGEWVTSGDIKNRPRGYDPAH